MQRVVIIKGENIQQISTRRLQYTGDGGVIHYGEKISPAEEKRTVEQGIDVTPYELQLILNSGWSIVNMCSLAENVSISTDCRGYDTKKMTGKTAILIILEKTTTPKATTQKTKTKENQGR